MNIDNTKYQNLWDVAIAVFRRKFTSLNAYSRNEKKKGAKIQ